MTPFLLGGRRMAIVVVLLIESTIGKYAFKSHVKFT
jgi:hypothetical protein